MVLWNGVLLKVTILTVNTVLVEFKNGLIDV